MKVQPIYRLKDERFIKRMIADSERDSAIFAIGINTSLRASDIFKSNDWKGEGSEAGTRD